jgi:MATE family multidrug resistance protein
MPPKRGGSPSPRRRDPDYETASVESDTVGGAKAATTGVSEPAAVVHAGLLPEIILQLRLALPATITYLFGRSLVSIALVFIGRMGDLELAAAALANTTSNVSGLSIIVGMGTAVSTICGQAYGAGNYRKVGETLQLAVLVNWAVCIPISILWWNAEGVLLLCGQDHSVAAAAGDYMRWLIPYIWCFSAQGALNAYLNAQRLMKPGAVSSILIAPIHLAVCYLMFEALGSDYLGGAKAMAISGIIQSMLIVSIVRCRGLHKNTWFGFSANCFTDVRRYCALALAGVISLSEWWASEICILLSGLLPRPEYTVASMSIFQITIGQCFYFSLGIGIACTTRVANLLGAGEPESARRSARAAMTAGLCVLTVLFSLMQMMRHQLPLVYTDDPVLQDLMAENFFVASFCVCHTANLSFIIIPSPVPNLCAALQSDRLVFSCRVYANQRRYCG